MKTLVKLVVGSIVLGSIVGCSSSKGVITGPDACVAARADYDRLKSSNDPHDQELAAELGAQLYKFCRNQTSPTVDTVDADCARAKEVYTQALYATKPDAAGLSGGFREADIARSQMEDACGISTFGPVMRQWLYLLAVVGSIAVITWLLMKLDKLMKGNVK